MNLSQLRYFKALAENKSFKTTVKTELISQSALSLAISRLEEELGCELFVRKKGSVDLTQEGEAFYQYISAGLRFIDNGVELVRDTSGEQKKEITIGAIYSAQSKDWSEVIYEYRKQTRGNVKIHVKQTTTQGVIKGLKRGTIDVAFGGTMGEDPDLCFFPCWTQQAALVVNKRHPFSNRREISLDELRGHYLISYYLEGPLAPELLRLVDGYDLQIDCLYADEITLASIVAANPDIMAIACRSWLLDAYLDEIKTIRIKEAPHDFRQLYMSYRVDIEQPKVVQKFIDVAKEVYRQQSLP